MTENKKPVRVWCDGCYDMVHFGHANQLRQAKQLGNRLVVGVHNDEEIMQHKGPAVFNEQERYRMVRGIKWVDEVVENAPYSTSVETLDKYDCDFCVHGNDITLTSEGVDTYADVKAAGRYKDERPGVSTTDLVGRMLLLTKTHHSHNEEFSGEHSERARSLSMCQDGQSPWTRVSRFMPTTKQILEFAEGRPPAPDDVIVYVCGAFDLFHIGHLAFLEAARQLGDYLIDVNDYKGGNYPIMSLHERVLSVLAYKPVSEVIIGAPIALTQEMIERFGIQIAVNGVAGGHADPDCDHEDERFTLAKELGIYRQVDSGSEMTTEKIIDRILENRRIYESRNKKKERKEAAAFKALQSMNEKNGTKVKSAFNVICVEDPK
ncbi:CTP:phosphoethanolamine cytidylyltransferase [Aphelenchoides fujianensis]|nr:CTP:phosphoethanolamine cytidylyltransferase [Aphelenchoides fujianensis]